MRAVVAGAGIGGLCAALALRRADWDVEVRERSPAAGERGAGITLQANAMTGLAALGLADEVRRLGRVDAPGGTRTRDGRWLARIDGADLQRVLGTEALGIHRATLHDILLGALPAGVVTTATVDGVPEDADLVVGADGIDSTLRRLRWPEAPSPAYAGSTAWRGITDDVWTGPLTVAISWAPGAEFGIVPLGDGRVSWFAAVNAPEGAPDRDVRALFGGWHDPIPALLAGTSVVLHHDLRYLPAPLPTYVRGNVVLVGDAAHAMTPNLGQGGAQAIEDAVELGACLPAGRPLAEGLADYDARRRPRSQAVAAASRRIGRFGQQLENPLLVAARNTLIRLTPPRFALRSMARWADWKPGG